MVNIIVINPSGEATAVNAAEGAPLMEVIRDNGFEEMLALCGGSCSCATCHVHIDPAYLGMMPAMSQDEDDLLDSSEHRDACSRLSCQILIAPELDGLKVTIAQPE